MGRYLKKELPPKPTDTSQLVDRGRFLANKAQDSTRLAARAVVMLMYLMGRRNILVDVWQERLEID